MSLYMAGCGNHMNNAAIHSPVTSMPQFFESIFLSELSPDVLPTEIGSIVRVSRAKYAAQTLSGVLMFDGERFCQQLEGPEAAVRKTVAKIAADSRHTCFQPLHQVLPAPPVVSKPGSLSGYWHPVAQVRCLRLDQSAEPQRSISWALYLAKVISSDFTFCSNLEFTARGTPTHVQRPLAA